MKTYDQYLSEVQVKQQYWDDLVAALAPFYDIPNAQDLLQLIATINPNRGDSFEVLQDKHIIELFTSHALLGIDPANEKMVSDYAKQIITNIKTTCSTFSNDQDFIVLLTKQCGEWFINNSNLTETNRIALSDRAKKLAASDTGDLKNQDTLARKFASIDAYLEDVCGIRSLTYLERYKLNKTVETFIDMIQSIA